MARNLRNKPKVDYLALHQGSSNGYRAFNVRNKRVSRKKTDVFDIEVLTTLPNQKALIHYVGWSDEYDEAVDSCSLIINVPPSDVNGPISFNSFSNVCRIRIRDELKGHNHCLPDRQVRIEVPETLTSIIEKKLKIAQFPMVMPLSTFQPFFGNEFHVMHYNNVSDRAVIATEIDCRIYRPTPCKYFEPIGNVLLEHRQRKNPIFVMNFSADRRPAGLV